MLNQEKYEKFNIDNHEKLMECNARYRNNFNKGNMISELLITNKEKNDFLKNVKVREYAEKDLKSIEDNLQLKLINKNGNYDSIYFGIYIGITRIRGEETFELNNYMKMELLKYDNFVIKNGDIFFVSILGNRDMRNLKILSIIKTMRIVIDNEYTLQNLKDTIMFFVKTYYIEQAKEQLNTYIENCEMKTEQDIINEKKEEEKRLEQFCDGCEECEWEGDHLKENCDCDDCNPEKFNKRMREEADNKAKKFKEDMLNEEKKKGFWHWLVN